MGWDGMGWDRLGASLRDPEELRETVQQVLPRSRHVGG